MRKEKREMGNEKGERRKGKWEMGKAKLWTTTRDIKLPKVYTLFCLKIFWDRERAHLPKRLMRSCWFP
jgi:hypothetical protein